MLIPFDDTYWNAHLQDGFSEERYRRVEMISELEEANVQSQ